MIEFVEIGFEIADRDMKACQFAWHLHEKVLQWCLDRKQLQDENSTEGSQSQLRCPVKY